jgi:ribonuclease Y
MTNLLIIISASVLGAIVIGLALGTFLYKRKYKRRQKEIEAKAGLVLKEAEIAAENLKKDKVLEAKEKILKMKSEFEEEANRKKNQIIANEQKIKQREQQVNRELEQLKRKEADLTETQQNLAHQLELVKKRKEELDRFNQQKVEILENISKLTADEAREQLVASLKDEAQTRASSYIKDIMEQAKLTATKEAKKIVIETIQRTATEHAIENCVSVFNIESDDIKGKSAHWKPQPVLKSLLTIPPKPSSFRVLTRCAGKSLAYPCIAWCRTDAFTRPALKKL